MSAPRRWSTSSRVGFPRRADIRSSSATKEVHSVEEKGAERESTTVLGPAAKIEIDEFRKKMEQKIDKRSMLTTKQHVEDVRDIMWQLEKEGEIVVHRIDVGHVRAP